MADTCRLCLSHNLVNNFIFDEDNKIYLKILSCLPIKVNRDDILPKKICDPCSCKVDDFYQFCHKSIDAENRLLLSTAETNPTKTGDLSVEYDNKIYQFTSSFLQFHPNGFTVSSTSPSLSSLVPESKCLVSSCTQTDDSSKLEYNIKVEPNTINDNDFFNQYEDEYSEHDVTEDVKEETTVPTSKKVEKLNSKTTTSKRKSTRKNKKEKSLKVKIKKSKIILDSALKSDSEEDDVSLVDMMKKDKSLKLDNHLVLDVKDIKEEMVGEVTLMECPNVQQVNNTLKIKHEEWNCCICFSKCYDKDEMLAHYRSHYSTKHVEEFDVTPEVIPNEEGEPVEAYLCSHCNHKSETKTSHIRHLRSHGLDKPYRCSLCEKTFRNTNEILKHGKNAHKYDSELQEVEGEEGGPVRAIKRFMCDLCDETFVYMKYVQIHRNLYHPEARERQFVNRCLHCGREFAHLNSLRRHLRSHSGERNFLCYICGKSLSSREHLKFHIRIHTGFKPHICKTCGKGFVKKCNLTLHERVHSGEKPHVCSHCGKAFSQRSTLVIHERYHSGARPYVCSICNKGFVAKGLLSMHLKTSCI